MFHIKLLKKSRTRISYPVIFFSKNVVFVRHTCCFILYYNNDSACHFMQIYGVATHYLLDSPGFKPQWGARFSKPILIGSQAHSVPCTVSTRSHSLRYSSWGVAVTTQSLQVPGLSMGRAVPLPVLCAFLACNGTALPFTYRIFSNLSRTLFTVLEG
jgi:hypothetical protein